MEESIYPEVVMCQCFRCGRWFRNGSKCPYCSEEKRRDWVTISGPGARYFLPDFANPNLGEDGMGH